MRIRVGQRRPRRRVNPQMRQLPFATGQAAADLPQRVRPTQLAEQHRDELAPTREPARMALGLRRDDRLLKLDPRK